MAESSCGPMRSLLRSEMQCLRRAGFVSNARQHFLGIAAAKDDRMVCISGGI